MMRLLMIVYVMGITSFIGAAYAQPGESPIDEVIANARQNGSMCPAEVKPIARAAPKLPEQGFDIACAAKDKDAQKLIADPNAVIADTRSTIEFGAYRINGAMNIAIQSIEHKEYLKQKSIVLVGNGKGERELYAACAAMRKAGFRKAVVLHGGMLGWLAADLPVVGNPVDVRELQTISASELFSESQFDRNLLVFDTHPGDVKKYFSNARFFASAKADDLEKLLKEESGRFSRKKSKESNFISSVILVAPNSLTHEALTRLRTAISPTPLLVYTDGISSLHQFLKSQEVMWQVYGRGPKQAKCHL